MIRRFAFICSLVAAGVAVGQNNQSIVTRALEPASEDLAKLNLTVAWRLYLPVENRGDGIATVQPIDDQVFVQLQSGRLIAIQAQADPKTFRRPGDVLWVYRPSQRPGVIQPLAASKTEVFVTHGMRLLVLDRADGKVKFSEEMISTGSDAPAVDQTAVYVPLANRRIVAYSHQEKIPGYRPAKPFEAPDPVHRISLIPEPADALSTPQNRSPSIARLEVLRPPFRRGVDSIDSSPSVGMLKNIRPPYREINAARSPSVGNLPNLRSVYDLTNKESETRIKFLWELHAPGRIDDTPLLTLDPTDPDSEILTTYTGRVIFTAKRQAARTNTIRTQYVAEAAITAPLTNHGDYLYVATADSNFVSFSMREMREPSLAANSLPRGKMTTGGPILQKPLLTSDAIYVIGERWGLMKLKHGTLDPLWLETLSEGRVRPRPNADIVRLLSANGSYVYGLDRRGYLVVVDAIRGTTLSSFNVSAFAFPVANRTNDRVYLASNNGLLICMHDRLRVQPELLVKPPKKEAPPEEPMKDPEPKEPAKN